LHINARCGGGDGHEREQSHYKPWSLDGDVIDNGY
jgi:hypothetical protein